MLGLSAMLAGGYAVSLLLGGCAAPRREIWPPHENEEKFMIVVFIEGLHSEIGIWPRDDPQGDDPDGFVSWSYGDRRFYMERDTGAWGTLRAVLLPTEGALRAHHGGWRLVNGPEELSDKTWVFHLTRQGHERLVSHLHAERRAANPLDATEHTRWYSARRSYHALHHCHHWTARALRAAGLPMWNSHAPFLWSLERQLDRANRFVN